MHPTDLTVHEILAALPQQRICWGQKIINADKAWERYSGAGIKVGVIDTGIDPQHTDLAANTAAHRSFVDTSSFDSCTHGTHVAGIVAAVNNSHGVVGVAHGAKIYSAKIFGAGGHFTSDAEFAALEWMIQKRVDIINMSYGGLFPTDLPGVPEFLQKYHNLIKRVADAGIIMVAAAGNSGNRMDTLDRVMWPARFPEVLAVGAISQEIQRADFSSTGPALDFAMPGVDIYSTHSGNQYAKFSGTSMAAPYLTGCIAILQEQAIKEMGRKLTFEQVKRKLVELSTDIGIEGVDVKFGYGMVNIGKVGIAPMKRTVVNLDQPLALDARTSRTLAPVRFIVEVNGGRIENWNQQTRTVVFRTADGKRVTMQVGNSETIIEE